MVRSGLATFLAQPLTVDIVAIAAGATPAVDGLDFVGQGTLGFSTVVARDTAFTFAPNQTTKVFRVPLLDDTVVDGPKTVEVGILSTTPANTSSPRGPGITFPATATITIADDETGGVIEFSAATYSVAEDVASGLATITLVRTGAPNLGSDVTVVAETGDSSRPPRRPRPVFPAATTRSTSTVVTFAAGAAATTFTVPILTDGVTADGVKTVNLAASLAPAGRRFAQRRSGRARRRCCASSTPARVSASSWPPTRSTRRRGRPPSRSSGPAT